MHTVELLERALQLAGRLGFRVREECVGGNGGGSCVLRGQKWLFLDPTLDISDQLELTCQALQADPGIHAIAVPVELAVLLRIRKAA